MLKQRVLTAIVLVALLLAVLLWLPAQGFLVFAGLCLGLAAWEWGALSGMGNTSHRLVYCALVLLLTGALTQLPQSGLVALVIVTALLWLAAAGTLVTLYPRGAQRWKRVPVLSVAGLLVLLPPFAALQVLSDSGAFRFHVLLLIAIVAAADIGAYFSGRAFGKHKLAPLVSPNKTWEGFAGGMLASCMVAWLVPLIHSWDWEWPQFLLITLATWVLVKASVIGDLFESMIKREAGVKDSGTLLPGHGGVLDRVDSLTAALPVYVALLQFSGVP